MAQATYTDKDGNEYTFKKHAFLDLQGGAQYTLGEAKFGDLISPNVQLGIGYQFSPVFGMRLQANGWQSKGGWNGYKATKMVLLILQITSLSMWPLAWTSCSTSPTSSAVGTLTVCSTLLLSSVVAPTSLGAMTR